jgi:hypothetical protein
VAYAVIAGLAFLAAGAAARRSRSRWGRALRRFQRPLPLTFGLAWLVALLGGMLHAPNNYDALSYRMPRILDWLGAGQWNWIETTSQRMNYSAANAEWLSAPLLVLTHSDRLLFILNLVPFLLLPGLIFSVYRQLGVGGRVAWAWMWVLPAAFCFALQAARIGNDLTGAVFVLASLNFGLRAARTGKAADAWLAVLAIALVTGIETTNLPLVLPCLVALWPARRLLTARPLASAGVLAVALLVSHLTTAVLNKHFNGDWNGYGPHANALRIHSPLAGMVSSTLKVSAQTLQPPLLPRAHAFDARLVAMLPDQVKSLLHVDYPQFELDLGELPQEEVSGLGLGVCLLLMASLLGRFFWRERRIPEDNSGQARTATWEMAASWVALLLYRNRVGCEPTARLLAPYFSLVLPSFIGQPGNERLIRKPWWRWAALLTVASAVVVVILTPSRPLWPASTILAKLHSRWPASGQLGRVQEVYSVYRERNDLLGPLRNCLPVGALKVGIVASEDDSEYALWRPFGLRTVTELGGTRPWKEETSGLIWVVGKTSLLNLRYGSSLEQIRLSSGAQVVATKLITSKVRDGPEEWFVMRLPGESSGRVERMQAMRQ